MNLTCIYIRDILCIYTGALLLHFSHWVAPARPRAEALAIAASAQQKTHAQGVTGYATATWHGAAPSQSGAVVVREKETTYVHRTEQGPRPPVLGGCLEQRQPSTLG